MSAAESRMRCRPLVWLMYLGLADLAACKPDRCDTPKDLIVGDKSRCTATCKHLGGSKGTIKIGKRRDPADAVGGVYAYCSCLHVPGHKKPLKVIKTLPKPDDIRANDDIFSTPGNCWSYCSQQGMLRLPPMTLIGEFWNYHHTSKDDTANEWIECTCFPAPPAEIDPASMEMLDYLVAMRRARENLHGGEPD